MDRLHSWDKFRHGFDCKAKHDSWAILDHHSIMLTLLRGDSLPVTILLLKDAIMWALSSKVESKSTSKIARLSFFFVNWTIVCLNEEKKVSFWVIHWLFSPVCHQLFMTLTGQERHRLDSQFFLPCKVSRTSWWILVLNSGNAGVLLVCEYRKTDWTHVGAQESLLSNLYHWSYCL